jgi:hypothetical protein
MGNSEHILRELTLRSISDDYETFERVFRDVCLWANERGIIADRASTLATLEGLIGNGYAQAYILSSRPPESVLPVTYARDRVGELWYYLTPEGKRLVDEMISDGKW